MSARTGLDCGSTESGGKVQFPASRKPPEECLDFGSCGYPFEPMARVERGAVAFFGALARGTNGTFRGPREHLALQTRLTIALGGAQEYLLGRRKVDNGNSG